MDRISLVHRLISHYLDLRIRQVMGINLVVKVLHLVKLRQFIACMSCVIRHPLEFFATDIIHHRLVLGF